MKKPGTYGWLPLAAAALSLTGFILRHWLYAVAVDQKNLLLANHPLELALWTVTAAGVLLILITVRKLGGSGNYRRNFGPSVSAAAGQVFLGCCLLTTVLFQPSTAGGAIGLLWRGLGALAAPAMVWGAIARRQGKKPFFGIHVLTCLFLLVHVVSRYQVWSGNPQLQDYVFELLAAICLSLFSYHCAAFEAGTGSRRMQLATGLLSILLAGPALSGTEYTALYLGGAVWAATNLCALTPPTKDKVIYYDPS